MNLDYSQLRQMYSFFSNTNNPMQMITQMAQFNPNLKPIVSALTKGISAEQIAREMLKNNGINPDEYLKNMTSGNDIERGTK